MNPLPDESLESYLNRMTEALGEHFDVVQVFTQVDNKDETHPYSAGSGNMFARARQMERWLKQFEFDDEEEF
jgi:hypothetical protein